MTNTLREDLMVLASGARQQHRDEAVERIASRIEAIEARQRANAQHDPGCPYMKWGRMGMVATCICWLSRSPLTEKPEPQRHSSLTWAEWVLEHPDLCPRCGWSKSAHGSSHGPNSDCPWGMSPSAKNRDLPDPATKET